MNQAMIVNADDRLGFPGINPSSFSGLNSYASQVAKQPPKWQSILTAIGTALPVGAAAYQSFRNPQSPQFQPQFQPQPDLSLRPIEDDRRRRRDDDDDINTSLGFSLDKGLNIGGTRIPVLYLALGLGALFLLYKEPPKRGR